MSILSGSPSYKAYPDASEVEQQWIARMEALANPSCSDTLRMNCHEAIAYILGDRQAETLLHYKERGFQMTSEELLANTTYPLRGRIFEHNLLLHSFLLLGSHDEDTLIGFHKFGMQSAEFCALEDLLCLYHRYYKRAVVYYEPVIAVR